jgi:hypothetical protein
VRGVLPLKSSRVVASHGYRNVCEESCQSQRGARNGGSGAAFIDTKKCLYGFKPGNLDGNGTRVLLELPDEILSHIMMDSGPIRILLPSEFVLSWLY